jgi:hypothetical protein
MPAAKSSSLRGTARDRLATEQTQAVWRRRARSILRHIDFNLLYHWFVGHTAGFFNDVLSAKLAGQDSTTKHV